MLSTILLSLLAIGLFFAVLAFVTWVIVAIVTGKRIFPNFSTGLFGAMASGNSKTFWIAVVMTAIISVVSWYVHNNKITLVYALLIPLHLWITYKLLDGGLKPTWAQGFRVASLATLYFILFQAGPGQMLQNDINALNVEAVARAEAGEGFFTGGSEGCENVSGMVEETPTTFTFRRDCVTYLNTSLLKHGEDSLSFDIDRAEKQHAYLNESDFIKESGWVMKDGRWMFKLVPNSIAFKNKSSIPMVAYSTKLRSE